MGRETEAFQRVVFSVDHGVELLVVVVELEHVLAEPAGQLAHPLEGRLELAGVREDLLPGLGGLLQALREVLGIGSQAFGEGVRDVEVEFRAGLAFQRLAEKTGVEVAEGLGQRGRPALVRLLN